MKPKVGFICVHNSCRSQMAEALAKLNASATFDAFSAGTEVKPAINPDAVRLMKQRYNIDMSKTHHSKLLQELPELDIVITMGCNVDCPWLPNKHREDWGLDDPSGHTDDIFNATIDLISSKIENLVERINSGAIDLS